MLENLFQRLASGTCHRHWRQKISSAAHAVVVVAITVTSALATDVDDEATLNTAIDNVNANTDNTINITGSFSLDGTPTITTITPSANAFIVVQGSPGNQTLTSVGSSSIFNFNLASSRTANLTFSDLTLIGGTGGNGLRLLGNGSLSIFNLNADSTFVSDISIFNTVVNIDSGDDFGANSNNVTFDSSMLLTATSSTTMFQSIVATNGGTMYFGADTGVVFEVAGNISEVGTKSLSFGVIPSFPHGGTLVLSGTNTYSGSTVVGDGTLLINGSILGAAVAQSTGTLGGSGIIGGNLTNSATVNPGGSLNSIGILTTNGTYVSNLNSTLQIDFDGTSNDLLVADAAALNGNGTVFVHDLSGTSTLVPGQHYTFLTTTSGITGEFAGVTDDMPLADILLGYTLDEAYFYIQNNNATFASVANSSNELSVATYLDQTKAGASGDYKTVLDTLILENPDSLRAAYDQLGGESFGTTGQFGIQTTTVMLHQLGNRLSSQSLFGPTGGTSSNLITQAPASATPELSADGIELVSYTTAPEFAGQCNAANCSRRIEHGWNRWSMGYGLGGSATSDGNASGAHYGMGGFLAGIDRWLDESTLVGGFAGYSGSSFHAGAPSANVRDNAGLGGLSLLQRGDVLYVSAVAGAQSDNYNSRRNINIGAINRTASADYDGWQTFGYSELGANLNHRRGTLQPFVDLQYIHLRQNAFSETGAGALNLVGGGLDTDSFRSLLGTRFFYDFRGDHARRLIPEFQASWLHEYADETAALNARFAAAGGSSFSTQGVNVGRDWAVLGAGLNFLATDNLRLSANYFAQTNDHQTFHGGSGNLTCRW